MVGENHQRRDRSQTVERGQSLPRRRMAGSSPGSRRDPHRRKPDHLRFGLDTASASAGAGTRSESNEKAINGTAQTTYRKAQ